MSPFANQLFSAMGLGAVISEGCECGCGQTVSQHYKTHCSTERHARIPIETTPRRTEPSTNSMVSDDISRVEILWFIFLS